MSGLSSREERLSNGQMAQAISQGVVRLLREYTGRGPTQAHTTLTGDLVVVVLRDTLHKAERSLVEDGHSEPVITMRRRYQETMREEMVTLVTAQTGREVEAFMSDNSVQPDVAVEFFILAPASGGAHPADRL
jgi:uncharacterized protein YbcI